MYDHMNWKELKTWKKPNKPAKRVLFWQLWKELLLIEALEERKDDTDAEAAQSTAFQDDIVVSIDIVRIMHTRQSTWSLSPIGERV